jgi:hypothetical protein
VWCDEADTRDSTLREHFGAIESIEATLFQSCGDEYVTSLYVSILVGPAWGWNHWADARQSCDGGAYYGTTDHGRLFMRGRDIGGNGKVDHDLEVQRICGSPVGRVEACWSGS